MVGTTEWSELLNCGSAALVRIVFTSSVAVLLLTSVSLEGCGARSGLEIELCGDAGSRPCETACGPGLQLCNEGRWSQCDVAPTEVSCSDACGAGVAQCQNGVIASCVVPPVRAPCGNVCGAGVALCANGRLGVCEVPPSSGSCETECGEGVAECREGIVGECVVAVTTRDCETACGEGISVCEAGRWGPCSAGLPLPPVLEVSVRDFRDSHPDFEGAVGNDRGYIAQALGPEDKPRYLGMSPTTNGRALFDQWYRDVPGTNQTTRIELELVEEPIGAGHFVFGDDAFFPIDEQLFGNEGRAHNFHFTLEAVAEFVYNGGETFRFAGDDDVFVFINRQLAIDLGGVHGTQEETVSLDELGSEFGLRLGGTFPIHLFFAERHTGRSTFAIDTTITRNLRCE